MSEVFQKLRRFVSSFDVGALMLLRFLLQRLRDDHVHAARIQTKRRASLQRMKRQQQKDDAASLSRLRRDF